MNWAPPKPASEWKDSTTGTVRSSTNPAVLTYAVMLLNYVFKWNISLEDLTPFAPAIPVGYGIFYRASLYASNKWKWIGYVLFGKPAEPTYA